MNCTNCGAPLSEGSKFCENCGRPVPQTAPRPAAPQPAAQRPEPRQTQAPQNSQQPAYRQPQPTYQQPAYTAPVIPPEYKPISAWGYFGYEILFAIPLIGLIFLIVYAVSAKNVNLKKFARSYFCVLILVLVITLILLATGAISSLSGALRG